MKQSDTLTEPQRKAVAAQNLAHRETDAVGGVLRGVASTLLSADALAELYAKLNTAELVRVALGAATMEEALEDASTTADLMQLLRDKVADLRQAKMDLELARRQHAQEMAEHKSDEELQAEVAKLKEQLQAANEDASRLYLHTGHISCCGLLHDGDECTCRRGQAVAMHLARLKGASDETK